MEELREELKLAKAATAAREYERFREVSENAMRRRRMRMRNVVLGVGAMAVAAGIALLLLLRPSASFVDTYFSPADPASVLRVEPADPVNVGMGHYEKGEYASAASEFGKVEENDPDYDLARFYRANCLVAMADLEGAKPILLGLDSLELEAYWEKVRWTLALIYLDQGDSDNGAALLRELRDDQRSNFKQPEIDAILKQLD